MWPFKKKIIEGSQEELLTLLKEDKANRESEAKAKAELNDQRVKDLRIAKSDANARKAEAKEQAKKAAVAHLKVMESYLERMESPDISEARKAELNAIVQVRKTRVEGLGFQIDPSLKMVLKKIELLSGS